MPGGVTWRSKLFGVLLCLSLLLGGCWSSREIDALAFIMAVGLDLDDNGDLIVSFRIADPSALAGGGSTGEQGGSGARTQTTFPVTVKARTPAEAMERLRLQLPRIPFMSHAQGIIVGESLARSGVSGILDFFERDEELRRSVQLFVTKDIQAAQIFTDVRQRLLTPSGMGFSELITHVAASEATPVARFGDFLEFMGNPRREAYAPALSLNPSDVTRDAPKDQVALVGTGIFRDDRLVGYLSHRESAVMQLLLSGIRAVSFHIDGDLQADVNVTPAGTRIKVVDPTAAEFHISVKVRAELQQLYTIGVAEGSALVNGLSRQLETQLKSSFEELIAHLQLLQSDVLGLGEVLYRSHPGIWKQVAPVWPEVFAKAEIEIDVEAVVTETGSILRSLNVTNKRRGGADDPTLGPLSPALPGSLTPPSSPVPSAQAPIPEPPQAGGESSQ